MFGGKLKINKKEIALVLIIFLLAFGIRGYLMQWDLFFGFDSYFHAKGVSYILEYGAIPATDPLAYYQLGGSIMEGYETFWYFSAMLYKAFTLNAPYDKELWIFFVKLIPALFGALTAVAMYFLGKEMFNSKKAGIATGVLAAVVPSYVYRTMAGFFEEDAIGFLWLVLGFYFLVRAQKEEGISKKSLGFAVVSGIFFSIMAAMWSMFLLVPIVLGGYFIIGAIDIFSKSGTKKLKHFVITFAASFVPFAAITSLIKGTGWMSQMFGYMLSPLPDGDFTLLIGLAVLMIGLFAYIIFASSKKIKENKALPFISAVMLYLVFFTMIAAFLTIDDLREGSTSIFDWTIGEENTGRQFFGLKYNAMIIFPWLALLIIPYYLYRKRDDKDFSHFAIIPFLWTAVTLAMAWYKLKFTYTFGLPIALCGGFIIWQTFEVIKKRNDLEKFIAVALVLLLLMTGIAAGSFFVTQRPPNIETTAGWKDALLWMKDNTPEDSKVFNWWDEGHWISFIAERSVSIDNRNISMEGDANFAQFILAEDENKAYEIVKSYGADYVIVSNDLLYKAVSMGIYAYQTINVNDPRMIGYFGTVIGCSKESNNDRIEYQCGSWRYDEETMNSLPTIWQEQQNSVVNVPSGGGYATIRVNIYRTEYNNALYVFSERSNKTMLVKLWMKKASTFEKFSEVYPGSAVKIFKIY